MLVYFSGDFLPKGKVCVSPDDRGFLFADGVYEVVRVYDGEPFLLDEHLQRLDRSLAAVRIDVDKHHNLPSVVRSLLDRNGLHDAEALIYLQITRGAASRGHSFPGPDVAPTVYVAAHPFEPHSGALYDDGVEAITVPDTRWTRCDIKSICLLPNVLASQQAKEVGAFEALFVRNGIVLEGSHTNLFAVLDGRLVTHPESPLILSGVTRGLVLDLARGRGLPCTEAPMSMDELCRSQEAFLSGTTTEIMPVVRVDGRIIGDGRPGPLTLGLIAALRERTGQ